MKFFILVMLQLAFFLPACGKKSSSSNNSNNNNPNQNGGPTNGGGFGGPDVMTPTVNMKGALALAVVDPSQNAGIKLIEEHNKMAALMGAPMFSHDNLALDLEPEQFGLLDSTTTSDVGENSLEKTDSKGNLTPAVTNTIVSITSSDTTSSSDTSTTSDTSNKNHGPEPTLPKILTIAVSPDPFNEVFVHFENAFRFTAPAADAVQQNGDQRGDGTFCQLFRVKGGTVAKLQAAAPSGANLECVDHNHFVNNWQGQRESVFQFDEHGNVYYSGQIPNSPSQVVYKWDRSTTKLTEMINSNICVNDFLVTPSGGIFYTGTSSCNNGGGGGSAGGGFFRYIAGADGTLYEIARDWYNFIYDPVSTATTDKAVFFGPDPTTATTASWNTACLFTFDPAGGDTTAKRTSTLVTCGLDIWGWIQMSRSEDTKTYGNGFQNGSTPSDAWKTEATNRCTSSGQIFAGGGSQISDISQTSAGDIYVIGNVQKKNAGTVSCNLEIRGPHCKLNGMPDLSYTSSTTCTDASGTWVDDGNCSDSTYSTSTTCFNGNASNTWMRKSDFYGSVTTAICNASGSMNATDWWDPSNAKSFQQAASASANTVKFRIENFGCTPPATSGGNGNQWTSEYQGLGKVNVDTKTLSLLSGTDEQAIKLWIINDNVYYSAYNAVAGKYLLRTWDGTKATTLIEDLEVYNLTDGGDGTSLYYDGLDFTDNSYSYGTVLIASPYTRAQKTGLTGTLKTMVILPKK